jgi:hypothetical protein
MGVGVVSGVRSYIARVLTGPKDPFIRVATLLGMPEAGLERMRSSSAEDCEMVLQRHLKLAHGGVVDWRGRFADIIETIGPALATEEHAALTSAGSGDNPGFPVAIRMLDGRLRPPMRALRAIGALGDAYIVFLAPREGLAEVDAMMRIWLV